MSTPKLNRIRRNLLRWFERNKRDLPWRRTRDPYAIWIAETMLQQTQVKTVLPYYRRFLRAFPTIQSLARASGERVLALWSGLGYYRRAENLQKAARTMVRADGGKIPRDFEALCALPGIGPYTAGAISSMAFNRPYPALDGNARRVLTRLFNIRREKDLREAGKRLVSPSRPGHWNQALMELGSKICCPREPNCPLCPVAQICAARRSGRFQLKSLSLSKRTIREVEWPLAVIQDNARILLRRRPGEGLLAGLWELPGGERRKGETLEAALIRHLDGLGERVCLGPVIGEIRHSITNRRIRAPVLVCSLAKKGRLPLRNWRWGSLATLHRFPLSSLSLKAIRLATER